MILDGDYQAIVAPVRVRRQSTSTVRPRVLRRSPSLGEFYGTSGRPEVPALSGPRSLGGAAELNQTECVTRPTDLPVQTIAFLEYLEEHNTTVSMAGSLRELIERRRDGAQRRALARRGAPVPIPVLVDPPRATRVAR